MDDKAKRVLPETLLLGLWGLWVLPHRCCLGARTAFCSCQCPEALALVPVPAQLHCASHKGWNAVDPSEWSLWSHWLAPAPAFQFPPMKGSRKISCFNSVLSPLVNCRPPGITPEHLLCLPAPYSHLHTFSPQHSEMAKNSTHLFSVFIPLLLSLFS